MRFWRASLNTNSAVRWWLLRMSTCIFLARSVSQQQISYEPEWHNPKRGTQPGSYCHRSCGVFVSCDGLISINHRSCSCSHDRRRASSPGQRVIGRFTWSALSKAACDDRSCGGIRRCSWWNDVYGSPGGPTDDAPEFCISLALFRVWPTLIAAPVEFSAIEGTFPYKAPRIVISYIN